MTPTKTAVVIDFYGTMTTSTPSEVWTEHATLSAAPLGIPVPEWREALDSSFGERATGVLGDLPTTLRILAERCGVTPSEERLAAACEARLRTQNSLYVFRDDVLASLAELRARGKRLALLSDCTVELPDAWSGLPVAEFFDVTVFSFEAGLRKPDARLFDLVTGGLGVAAEECLYIGDGGGQELTGATKAGMTAVMLRAPDWHVNFAHGRENEWDGEVVESFTEFLARPDLAAS